MPDYTQIAEDALRILDILCRQPSVSAEGRALDETAAVVEELLTEAGFDTQHLRADDGPPAVFGEQRGRSGYTLLFYNHYDVQPVDPLDLWTTPPFEPARRDGKLFARGASDNKGELAVRLAVVRALRANGRLPITLRWIVEGEEEVGSPNFGEIVRRNAAVLEADGALWEGSAAQLSDGRPVLRLGFKGALAVRFDVRRLATDAHSGLAAIAPSASWRLIDLLASIRDDEGDVRIAGFYDRALGPTDAERRALGEASFTEEDGLRDVLGVGEFVDGVSGAAFLERLCFRPTSNIAGIATGYSGPGMKTVLPAAASAWMDFRLVPEQQPDEILELLRAHLGREGFDDVELTTLVSAKPATTPLDDPFVQQVLRVAEEASGRPASVVPLAAGTLPIIAALQEHLRVPGLSAPDNPIYSGSRAHAPDEHIRLADVEPAVRFTYMLLEDLAGA